ncbi:hypothetical protein FB563_6174 [Streptomyces puniciscabiei]|uniref:Uncharacterized protein n=1 Tax=Streptomyces puniciscabiei TaxID=164348 RepID=A0A542TGX6_9ACTN|nr:hypothetical protein FB563_6174 [Streptomyces puniciscabiei]
MPFPIARRYLLSTVLAVVLIAFSYYALQPVRVTCALSSGPYGSAWTQTLPTRPAMVSVAENACAS